MKKAKRKARREQQTRDGIDWLNLLANLSLCLVGLGFVCIVFGWSGWGLALFLVSLVIALLLVAFHFIVAIVSARIMKNVPHR